MKVCGQILVLAKFRKVMIKNIQSLNFKAVQISSQKIKPNN